MKNTNLLKSFRIFLLWMTILFMSSCITPPANMKIIPKETNIVSAINIHSIVKKGKLNEVSDLKIFRTLKKEIRNENRKFSKLINGLFEDPTISGIDFTADMFAYYINEYHDEKYMCFSAAIKSEGDFTEFVEDLLDRLKIDFELEKESDYSYIIINNKFAIGWDSEKALLLFAENQSSVENLDMEIETLFGLKEKGQITSNDKFTKFYKNKKDISLWLSSNLFEDNDKFRKIEDETDIDITDNYISLYLNFGYDKISLLTTFTANNEIQKLMNKNYIWNNKFNTKLLDYFPQHNYAIARVSINPLAYYKLFEQQENFERIQDEFEEKTKLDLFEIIKSINGNFVFSLFGFENISYSHASPGYGFNIAASRKLDKRYKISKAGELSIEERSMLDEGKTIQSKTFSKRYCINIQNILNDGGNIETAIKNDSKINWYEGGWEYGEYDETTIEELSPLMSMAFGINDSKMVEEIIDIIPENVLTKKKSYYEFQFNNKYPIYFGFNKKMCFVTNNSKSIKVFDNGGYQENSLSRSGMKPDMERSSFFSYINLDYDSYPRDIQKKISENANGKEEKLQGIWNEFAKGLEIKAVGSNSFEVVFEIKNSDYNSLNTIVTTIDNNYKDFVSLSE